MFARIKFEGLDNVITPEQLARLKEILSDEVGVVDAVRRVNADDARETYFMSYSHTYNPDEVGVDASRKTLVEKTGNYILSTGDKEYFADAAWLMEEFPNLRFTMRGIAKQRNNFTDLLVEAEQKLTDALQKFNQQVEFNQHCDVHIGNIGLLHINQLGYAVDKCTEEMQDVLNDGWRILAVCPQPNQRRPDYMLGRYRPGDAHNIRCVQF